MQAPATLAIDDDPSELDEELSHTHLFLKASKPAQGLAPTFEQLIGDLATLAPKRAAARRAVEAQDAAVIFVDDDLNVLLDDTKKAVLAFVGNDYAAPLYKQLFGNQSPSELRRFLLGEQLETMRLWPSILGGTSDSKLQALGVAITSAVKRADDVLAARAQAQTALDAFIAGPWTAFIAAGNGARGAAFGALIKITEDPANGPLPPEYVDRFFMRDTSGRAPRLEELERRVTRLTEQLAVATARRDALKAKQASAALAKLQGELNAKKEALASAEETAKQAAAEIAALEAEIAKGQGK